ncbi:MAG: CPBP family intramembrane metalloprotease [Candidatus Heimdallarchaeota archaeon]|nr:CPBP family intramembrane metalloprotease [Candidatus Heimdallarchaeota archaeon]
MFKRDNDNKVIISRVNSRYQIYGWKGRKFMEKNSRNNNFERNFTNNENEFESPRERDETLDEKDENFSTITCPSCLGENLASNKFCNFCGYRLDGRIKCLNCGQEPKLNPFCSFCGAPLMRAQSSTPPQPYIEAPSPEELRESRLKKFNLLGTILGFLLILTALGTIAMFFLFLFVIYPETILGLNEGWGQTFGALLGIFLVPAIIELFSGFAIITHRPDKNAWKGFYQSLRFTFLALSIVTLGISFIAVIGWTFYVPNELVETDLFFWFFSAISIPVNTSLIGLWIIELFVFLLCVAFLVTPKIISVIRARKEGANSEDVSLANQQATTEELDERIIQEPEESTKRRVFILEIDKEKMRKIEETKGRLPELFYKIKNNDLVQIQELLALSLIASIYFMIRLFSFSIEGYEGLFLHDVDDALTIIDLAWASIFEEISFRIILIGFPMIFVILIRYFQESKSTAQEKRVYKWWDIPRAIRGKYKQIGIPELVLVGISSILFGFAHWSFWTGGWPFWKIFEAGLSGIFFGYAFIKYGIEGSIFIHFGTNVMIGLLSYTTGVEWIPGCAIFFIICILALGIMKVISLGVNGFLWFKISTDKG